ncbi:unnamed protein product, partial [Ixodes persulcatus]
MKPEAGGFPSKANDHVLNGPLKRLLNVRPPPPFIVAARTFTSLSVALVRCLDRFFDRRVWFPIVLPQIEGSQTGMYGRNRTPSTPLEDARSRHHGASVACGISTPALSPSVEVEKRGG